MHIRCGGNVFAEPLPINGSTRYNILLEAFTATVRNEVFSAAQPCRDGDSIQRDFFIGRG
jgi:hypothetical protein